MAKMSNFLLFICFALFLFANNSKQLDIRDTSHWLQDEIDPDPALVDSLNRICFKLRGSDPAKAILIGKRALEYAKQINYSKGYLMSHSFLGVSYRNISDYTSAMDYYSRAFFLADSLNDKEQKAYAYNNIGNLFLLQGKYSIALRNIYNALKIGEEIDDRRIIAYSHINLGRIYSALKNWDEAVKYLTYSVEERKHLNDNWGVANALIEMAEVYENSKKYDRAIEIFDEASLIADKISNSQRLHSEVYFGKGKVFLNKNKPLKAKVSFNKALEFAKEINDKRMIMDNYYYLSLLFEDLNQSKNALNFHKKYVDYKDSVYTIETQNQISRLQIQYQTKEVDNENNLLRRNNEIQVLQLSKNRTTVNFLILTTILLTILGVFIYSRLKAKQKTALLLKEKNTEILKQKMELAELNATKDKFFSIIGHDLKNPFGSLIGNTEYLLDEMDDLTAEESKRILNAIRNSSKSGYELLENLLIWSKTQRGQIRFLEERFNLKELVEKNVKLHKNTAVLKNVELINNLTEDIEISADKTMLHTVINNLINNALKFTSEKGQVIVDSRFDNRTVELSIKDTGTGMTLEVLAGIFKLDKRNSVTGTQGETGTGLGLIICKEFIDAHSGTLKIESEYGTGTTVKIRLPFKSS